MKNPSCVDNNNQRSLQTNNYAADNYATAGKIVFTAIIVIIRFFAYLFVFAVFAVIMVFVVVAFIFMNYI